MLGNYRVAAQLVGSRVVLSSTGLVSARYITMILWSRSVVKMMDLLFGSSNIIRRGIVFHLWDSVINILIILGTYRVLLSSDTSSLYNFCYWSQMYGNFSDHSASLGNLKNNIFCDVTLCGSCENWCFRGRYTSIIRVTRIGELGMTLAVTSNRSMLQRKFGC
jgi:hypothetical protein